MLLVELVRHSQQHVSVVAYLASVAHLAFEAESLASA